MNNQENEARLREELQKQIQQIEAQAQSYMTKEAVTRYGTLKSAHPDKAIQAAVLISQLASQNQIKEKITDQQFKSLLMRLEPEKRETKIIRK